LIFDPTPEQLAAAEAALNVVTVPPEMDQEEVAKRLIALGMNRFYISIHGHTMKLHEGLTRTPLATMNTRYWSPGSSHT
jgi:hypothetical protein